jgi:2-dehydro-3-deoxygluconokinase
MIVSFGEAMIRLAPPHFQRLEQTRTLDVEVGGAELNTAVGLVRLGRQAAWVSVVPDNPLGRLVCNRVRESGVNAEFVQLVNEEDPGRCGLYFLEFGAAPRASSILYDRAGSSISQAKPGGLRFWSGWKPGTFDWLSIFDKAKWFHVSGITAAILADRDVLMEAVLKAREAGLKTSIDLNYRSKLWSASEAGKVMAGLLKHCDLLIASETDAEQLFGITGTHFADVAEQLCERFGTIWVASVRRETPLVWRNKFAAVGWTNGQLHETAAYEVEIVDRLGTGDALAAGLIHGLLDRDFVKGLEYGAAMGALQHTIPGDLPWITRDEVEALLGGGGLRIQR